MGVDLSDPAVLSEHLAATVDLLRARIGAVEPADVARRVGENLMRRTRPEPIGPLAQLAAAATLEPTTRLRLRTCLRARLDGAGEQLRLVLLDRTIALPAATSDALKVVLAGAAVTPAELPGLDGDEQLTFAARLLREGVLVPASMES
jgi:hypothetical protein